MDVTVLPQRQYRIHHNEREEDKTSALDERALHIYFRIRCSFSGGTFDRGGEFASYRH